MQVQRFLSFDECRDIWNETASIVKPYPFQQLWYMELFFKNFAKKEDLFLLGIFEEQQLLALGAFEKVGQTILFLGTKDVSQTPDLVQDITDFGDILYTQLGKEKADMIWESIFAYFKEQGFSQLQLDYIREDSPTYTVLHQQAYLNVSQQEVSPYILVPQLWEEYLSSLQKKQRHELKRKINRLSKIPYTFERKDITKENFDSFITLHKLSDFNKAKFMTESMEHFFWDVVSTKKLFWQTFLYTLSIEEKEVSSVLVFENDEQILLYNSGFDPSFGYYSVGLLGKAFILKHTIKEEKHVYDFLRGNERYKYDLGAHDLPLFQIKNF